MMTKTGFGARRPLRCSLAWMVCGFLAATVAAAPPEPAAEEAWYVVTIAGAPVGSVREELRREGEALVFAAELTLVLNRMGSRVEMASTAVSRESPGGQLLSADFRLRASAQETFRRAVVEEDAVRIEEQVGERSFQRTVERPGEVLGPEGVRRLSAESLLAPGDTVRYRIFLAELGAVTAVERTAVRREVVESLGRDVGALVVEEKVEAMPLPTTLWMDEAGRLVRSEQAGPFGQTVVYRAPEAEALTAASGGELPEESYGASLVRTGLRIPRAREVERLVLRLRHRRPELGWPELEGAGQEVLERAGDTLTLAVSRRRPAGGYPFPVAASGEMRPYLEANAYVQSDDPELVALAREVVGSEEDLLEAALALERWVADNMRFDMGVVLAPSGEIFRDRRGTCTEYAVLLTALTRAVGIPSRFVMGYVYIGGIFGGHAWTEVRVGEEWVALDGAVPTAGPADAARFAFQWSSLAEGVGHLALGPAMQMYGQIDLEVVEIGYPGGERLAIPPGAAPYAVEGDVYRNPWLGLQLTRPRGFRFTDLDAVWPEATLVGLAGPEGREASFSILPRRFWQSPEAAAREVLEEQIPGGGAPRRTEVAGDGAWTVATPERAALLLPRSGELWLLETSGAEAPDLLEELAGGLRLTPPGPREAGGPAPAAGEHPAPSHPGGP